MPEHDAAVADAVDALTQAGLVIARYIQPGERSAEATVDELIGILDNRRVAAAIDRLQSPVEKPEAKAA
jgi:hypothetical protein